MVAKKAVEKPTCSCPMCNKPGCIPICMGILLLIAAGMLYLGYGWMHILGVFGILAILKGLYIYSKKK